MSKYDPKPIKVKRLSLSTSKYNPDDAPECQKKGCTNKVKWRRTDWTTYCGDECRLKGQSFTVGN